MALFLPSASSIECVQHPTAFPFFGLTIFNAEAAQNLGALLLNFIGNECIDEKWDAAHNQATARACRPIDDNRMLLEPLLI
jgi:hypothetical protein